MSRSTAQVKPVGKRRVHRVKPKKRRSRPAAMGYSDKIPAARMKRLVAFGVDEVFVHLLMSVIGVPIGGIGGPILSALYFGAQDATLGAGRSLGRAAVGQRLMSADGEALTVGQTIKRNALRYLMWLLIIPFFIDVGIVLFGDGRTLADRLCGTRVWEDPVRVRQKHMADKMDARSLRNAEAEAWGDQAQDEFMVAAEAELAGVDYEAEELRRFESELERAAAAVIDVEADVRPAPQVERAMAPTVEATREEAPVERGQVSKTKPLTSVTVGTPDPSRFSDDELAAQLEALESAMEPAVERPERETTVEEAAVQTEGFSLLEQDGGWTLPEMAEDVDVFEPVPEKAEQK